MEEAIVATLDDLALLIEKPKRKRRDGLPALIGCCPAHGDSHPSFSAWEGHDGWLHFHCFCGCSEAAILVALGWDENERRIAGADHPTDKPSQSTEYVYKGEDGHPLFVKTRYYKRKTPGEPLAKSFYIEGIKDGSRVDGIGYLNGARDTLYQLPDVLKHKADRTIYVVNGEKAADRMRQEKLLATCQPFGEGKDKWKPRHTELLRGAKHVVIVAQRDSTGEEYASFIASCLMGNVVKVEVVSPATMGDKHDAYDHFQAGHKADKFIERLDLMPKCIRTMPLSEALMELGIVHLANVDPIEIEWLWYPYLPKGRLTLLEGDGDMGKSYLTLALAACLSQGHLPNGQKLPHGPANILILASEDRADDVIVPRILKLGGDKSRLYHIKDLFAFDSEGLKRIDDACSVLTPVLTCVDPVLGYIGLTKALDGRMVDINSASSVRPVFDAFGNVIEKHMTVALDIRHHGKGEERSVKSRGLGSVDIRNVHRSQLTVMPHKTIKGLRVVRHEKHNYTEEGDPFGYEWRDGQFMWRWDIPDDTNTGRPREQREGAKRFLRSYFGALGCIRRHEVVTAGMELGFSDDTLYRALTELGGHSTKKGFTDGESRWYLTPEVDPFA